MNPLIADETFFATLISGDVPALQRILTKDFILIDVMSGSAITKAEFLALMDSGQLQFESIVPADNRVRIYESTAIITGRTQMSGRMGNAPFSASSRYTHVYVMQENEWRLATAQGTPISTPAA